MKTKFALLAITMALFAGANWAAAQGTAFTYQGQLLNSSTPVNGSIYLNFALYGPAMGGGQVLVAGPIAPVGGALVNVNNGLFTVTLDFGSSPNPFTGQSLLLEIQQSPSGNPGTYAALTPRLQLTPTPYAIFANTAGNLSGTLPVGQLNGQIGNMQLANNSINVNAGTGLSGGGAVALGGSTTLNNAGVLTVTGNSDITANTLGGAVTLGDTATSAGTPNLIVKRDGGGSFSAGSLTLAGNLNLPATSSSSGIIYSGGSLFMHAYGTQNFFAGANAGNLNMTGTANTGVGWQALLSNTTGIENAAVGTAALEFNTTGEQNTAMGNGVMEINNGSQNTGTGFQALQNNTTGGQNTASGSQALYSNTNGTANVADGFNALYSNTRGYQNTADGAQSLLYNTSGNYNTAIGDEALYNNINASANTAIGSQALWANTNGEYNTAIGNGALFQATAGFDNTAVGFSALGSLLSIYGGNIAVGWSAGGNLETGNNNIYIGNQGLINENGTIRIGQSPNNTSVYITGISGATAASGVAVYVNSSGQLGTMTSSRRYKQDIQGMDQASDVLYALKPVTFKYKPGIDPQGIPQFGLVAEDVEKVAPQLVAHDDQGKIYTVRYQAVDAMLLNEFLKEHRTVEEQSTEIQTLQQSVTQLKAMISQLAQAKTKQ